MINQTHPDRRDDETVLVCPNVKEQHRGEIFSACYWVSLKTPNVAQEKKNKFKCWVKCIKITCRASCSLATRAAGLEVLPWHLVFMHLFKNGDLSSASVSLPYVYFWIPKPSGWKINPHKWALAQLQQRGGKKTQTRIMESFTLRMCVPVSPLLFVQLSHMQHVCLGAFDAGWWESHQLFSESWSRTNGLNVWD